MPLLADTSVWVAYLRQGLRGPARALDGWLAAGGVVLCGPVAAEILAGAPLSSRGTLRQLLGGLDWVHLDQDGWFRAGEAAAELRAKGNTVALTDIQVALAAIAGRAELWTFDGDFQRVATALPELRFFRPVESSEAPTDTSPTDT
ncbi:MAG: PIN domain-containing protein [Chloroflexota bacterium]